MKSIELFVGGGGLALGVAQAGFEPQLLVEWDKDACETLRRNKPWNIVQGDVRKISFHEYEDVDLLAGGPPCQPFSLGGRHRGNSDERNMFPEMLRAVRETRPKIVLIENVKGLLREKFSRYFEYILLQLQYPEVVQKDNESWIEHLTRLEQYHAKGRYDGLHYRVLFRLVNAADYGVPQKRERVFIIAFRCDLERKWSFPAPTHSQDALLQSQWITGEYWERHGISRRDRPPMPEKIKNKLQKLLQIDMLQTKPWQTVRDAISDLPDPEFNSSASTFPDHIFNPGARIYPGHTGSPLDEPAKTLKAGDHGVPGGENMLVRLDGSVRYFTVRESARIQTFPDNYRFCGSWTESMRQLGNAVPVRLANIVASSLYAFLESLPRNKEAQGVGQTIQSA